MFFTHAIIIALPPRTESGKFFRSGGGKFLRPDQLDHDDDDDSSSDEEEDVVVRQKNDGDDKPSAKLSSDEDGEDDGEGGDQAGAGTVRGDVGEGRACGVGGGRAMRGFR